jgi:hypothetical protein
MTEWLPPPQYDRTPARAVVEHVLTSDAVNRICHEIGALDQEGNPAPQTYIFKGCTKIIASGWGCEIWRIEDGIVRRHEIGHCNGWPASHPR